MGTRAKFVVESVNPFNENSVSIQAHAVYEGSEENKDFWKYTPSGQLHMTVSNPNIFGFFEVGKEYYLDFTKA